MPTLEEGKLVYVPTKYKECIRCGGIRPLLKECPTCEEFSKKTCSCGHTAGLHEFFVGPRSQRFKTLCTTYKCDINSCTRHWELEHKKVREFRKVDPTWNIVEGDLPNPEAVENRRRERVELEVIEAELKTRARAIEGDKQNCPGQRLQVIQEDETIFENPEQEEVVEYDEVE